MKQNCWEFKDCGREYGGVNVAHLGTCPVATETRLDGVHGGKNAGRACWVVGGSFCGGKVQGTYAQKQATCMSCDFFNAVKTEEGSDLTGTISLLLKVQH